MKLSEAIRLGAMIRPQNFGMLIGPIEGIKDVASCALGAAGEACGVLHYDAEIQGLTDAAPYAELEVRWPLLSKRSAGLMCPACGMVHSGILTAFNVSDMIQTLNDSHSWSRERIADWVEQLELAEEGKATAITRDELYARAGINGDALLLQDQR